ncbi:MAG: hypothetical protein GXP39_18200, partial [Chloroflexi bacterium]|nr:hypothetical protein [Chloroflexota bacterium]
MQATVNAQFEEAKHLVSELRQQTAWHLFTISLVFTWLWMMVAIFGRPQVA